MESFRWEPELLGAGRNGQEALDSLVAKLNELAAMGDELWRELSGFRVEQITTALPIPRPNPTKPAPVMSAKKTQKRLIWYEAQLNDQRDWDAHYQQHQQPPVRQQTHWVAGWTEPVLIRNSDGEEPEGESG